MTWDEAYWSCNEMNATLATLETNKEDHSLKNAIKKHKKRMYWHKKNYCKIFI